MSKHSPAKLRAGESYFDLLVLVFSLVVLVLAYRISGLVLSGAGTFPMVSSAVMVGSMLFVLKGNRKKAKVNDEGFGSEFRQMLHEIFTWDFIIFSIICILYVIAIEPLHFLPSSFVFLVLSMIYLRGSTPLKASMIGAGTLACIYVIFLYFFKVILP